MSKRTILHIILWVAAVVCFGLTGWSYLAWQDRGGSQEDPARWHWMVYMAVGVVFIAIWYFTREKEEEISITRSQ